MNPKLTKWIKWIGLIKKDIVHLSTLHKVHSDFVDIVKSNPIVNQENLFFWYIEQTYYSCILSGVRRHDVDKMCSASLANLLKDMIENPKEYNKNEYNRPEDKTFSEFGLIDTPEYADTTGNYLNEELIKNDYEQLTQRIKSCCDFVDRRIAHLDARPMDSIFPPDYSTINDCIKIIDDTFIKYNGLLTRTSTNTIIHDVKRWQNMFKNAWVKPDAVF